MFLFNPPFWPFKNNWTCQKSCFLIRRVWKGLFPIWPPPRGLVLPKYESVVKLSNGHTDMFFFTLHFWPFKNHWTGQKSCSLIRRVLKKPFFYLTSPRGSCFAKIRVSCQTFKMVLERCFYLIPHFWPFKNHWTGQKSWFLIRRVLKKPFSIWPHPPGGLLLPK